MLKVDVAYRTHPDLRVGQRSARAIIIMFPFRCQCRGNVSSQLCLPTPDAIIFLATTAHHFTQGPSSLPPSFFFFRVGETVVEERLSLSCCSRGREAKQAAMAGDLLLTSFDKSSEAIHTAPADILAAVGWVRDPASPGHVFVTDVSQHHGAGTRPLTRMFFCVYVWLKKQNNHTKN